jgi:hypothetical protein
MNTEELTEKQTPREPMHFDAHEFDGLWNGSEAYADTLIDRADRFIRSNPWLCTALAFAAGCAIAAALTRCCQSSETPQSTGETA